MMRKHAYAATAALFALAACAKSDDATPDSTAAQPAGGPPAATAPATVPDQEFLAKMTDHHAGMIEMAQAAMTKASRPATQTDAHNLHTKQQAESDSMVAMIRTDFNGSHTPTVMPENRMMMDSLAAKSGTAYDREFYAQTVRHHQEGIRMIDEYLPRLTNDKVRSMAERMKADQQKEIAEFEKKSKG